MRQVAQGWDEDDLAGPTSVDFAVATAAVVAVVVAAAAVAAAVDYVAGVVGG